MAVWVSPIRSARKILHSRKPKAHTMNATKPSIIPNPSGESSRCQHRSLKGRCRQLVTDSAGTLCFHHARAQRQAKDDFSFLPELVRKPDDFQSVEGINEDLAALHNLLAQGRISPRRASVIAYIDSLLLRTALELEEKAKGSLNYYGQPIEPFDYSSLRTRQSDSTSPDVPDSVSEPTPVTS
jgi:hypothetical protein